MLHRRRAHLPPGGLISRIPGYFTTRKCRRSPQHLGCVAHMHHRSKMSLQRLVSTIHSIILPEFVCTLPFHHHRCSIQDRRSRLSKSISDVRRLDIFAILVTTANFKNEISLLFLELSLGDCCGQLRHAATRQNITANQNTTKTLGDTLRATWQEITPIKHRQNTPDILRQWLCTAWSFAPRVCFWT